MHGTPANEGWGDQDLGVISGAARRLATELFPVSLHLPKNTARGRKVIVLRDGAGGQYLLEIARSAVQRFYLERSVQYLEQFHAFGTSLSLNPPALSGDLQEGAYVLYRRFPSPEYSRTGASVDALLEMYRRHAVEISVDETASATVISGLLSAWPQEMHPFIRRLGQFRRYSEAFRRLPSVRLCFEHGDFSWNNLLKVEGRTYLVDFEYARERQPVGFDIYWHDRSTYGLPPSNERCFYHDLHEIKYELVHSVSYALDNGFTDCVVYEEFDDDLMRHWEAACAAVHPQARKPGWFKQWWVEHGAADGKPFLFSVWDGESLTGVLPLFEQDFVLQFMGEDITPVDESRMPYANEAAIRRLFDYVDARNLFVDFRCVNRHSGLSAWVATQLQRRGITHHVRDGNPDSRCCSFATARRPEVLLRRYRAKLSAVSRQLRQAVRRLRLAVRNALLNARVQSVLLGLPQWDELLTKGIPGLS